MDFVKELLDEKVEQYNRPEFIESDPIQIPHRFSRKEDIEIAAFLTSSIAWGNRKMIIRNAEKIANIFGGEPYRFVMEHSENDLLVCRKFVHRTFNSNDLIFFIQSLAALYRNYGGLEKIFTDSFAQSQDIFRAIADFRKIFFSIPHPAHTLKHISDTDKNSAAKRMNMFLMWMIRNDKRKVHFGLWKGIPMNALQIPLDVHVGNTARALELIARKQNDRRTVLELTAKLRTFDANDPVKYDFALFGLGVFEKFNKGSSENMLGRGLLSLQKRSLLL